MLPASPVFLAFLLLVNAIVGMTLGVAGGRIAETAATRRLGRLFQTWGLYRDAVLGALTFLLALVAIAFMPWPQNTITYSLEHARVTSTMNSFQYPYRVAVPLAIIVPAIYELYRLRRSR